MGITPRNLHSSASHDDLPELPIVNLTEEELTSIRNKAESQSMGTSDGLGGTLSGDHTTGRMKNDDPDSDEIVTEGFDLKEDTESKGETKVA